MRILIVDDEPGLAAALAHVLRCRSRYSSISTATSYDEGLQAALAERPDVAILDHKLGAESRTGADLAAELRKRAPMVRTLILTADTSPKVAFRALRAGADGFILKEGICGRLDAAIDTVLAGNRYVDPAVAGDALLLAQSSERAETPRVTAAEREVLRAVARGLTNEQISLERRRSVETVRAQLHSIYRKLGVSSREEALESARELGWL